MSSFHAYRNGVYQGHWTGAVTDYEGVTAGNEPVQPVPTIADERASMECSPLQGKLALGEQRWSIVEDVLADPNTPWAMKQTITSASQWRRLSQSMDEFRWVLNMTDEEVDDMFRLAMTIEV